MSRLSLPLGRSFLGISTFCALFAVAQPLAAAPKQAPQKDAAHYTVHTLPLPDNNTGNVSMDYITYDPSTNSVWVPGGNTGAVDVVDAASGKVRQISGIPTKEVEGRGGTKRVLGPTAVSVGEGVVYIGNRGDSTVCAFDAKSLTKGACAHLDATPDGVCYVAPTNEVWVTTPGNKSIVILDAKTLDQKGKLTFEGNPEGYAVDAKRGRFYTNARNCTVSKDGTVFLAHGGVQLAALVVASPGS